ncbi:hypothetical protein [Roseovarius aestuariivivens]|uniref:hypothetical protein n=1 Tax=Roseovarius aestuariivivens TaxID=1888910 RepID=UPI0010809F93|nr:hypothetical protein [Roseovarius aestuariivivens]
MISTPKNPTFQSSAGTGALSRLFSRFLKAMEDHLRIASRRDLIEKLEAKSDAELAELGIKREDIAMHVLRDMFYA